MKLLTVGLTLFYILLLTISSVHAEQEASEKVGRNGAGATTNKKKVAVVTLVSTAKYVPGAEVLGESLKHVKATGDRVVLWISAEDDPRSDITEEHLQDLKDAGWERFIQLTKKDGTFTECKVTEEQKRQLQASTSDLGGVDRYWGTCSKFAVWTLSEYDTVVYIDADSVALGNFDFVYDDDAPFIAQGTPGCWEEPPNYVCDAFYGAFMVIKPTPNIGEYLHKVAETTSLPGGELLLLNQIINNWKPLPRYTLVAQTETARPLIDPNRPEVDWAQVKVYDFAGRPNTKPWEVYRLRKETGDEYAHGYFKRLTPSHAGFHRFTHPQLVWSQYYDAILKRKRISAAKDEL
mmetsp:Transcript_3046/g.4970  ORF Transcript_3046/g.4970 Transcript_3046/m.4970 type:complete len:349 (-) Transcript_3046:359-1405(-)|eukprot:CAMPEP_0119016994 /NCGR_PEP_ID=MMETSP1176-20130426/15011_1 /TAXON_ID=265551 /ORGANISM="Synedropsis recta cf, Strain CCMP1620" /LENGTH=348 /DNA_ID=CAMNT_0006970583 /DNA_START=1 /DNA_END=1047 /DNA_ORIENTATION=+